ncbi:hypothetical protein A7C99_1074 [Trichophyton rubrum]|uniref:Uncharacterized protein n=1 Tax=Trichophyton rubrum TaxID=5551 RepID=A0A178F634_TRIRU|nr:hypothetical protein A7C99_1074 [Trichophyton rubrum]
MKLVVELESLKLKKRMKLELELKLKLEEKKKKKKRKGLKFPFAEFISPRLKSHAADSADNGVSLSRFLLQLQLPAFLLLLPLPCLPLQMPCSVCRDAAFCSPDASAAQLREAMGGLQGALHTYPIAIT